MAESDCERPKIGLKWGREALKEAYILWSSQTNRKNWEIIRKNVEPGRSRRCSGRCQAFGKSASNSEPVPFPGFNHAYLIIFYRVWLTPRNLFKKAGSLSIKWGKKWSQLYETRFNYPRRRKKNLRNQRKPPSVIADQTDNFPPESEEKNQYRLADRFFVFISFLVLLLCWIDCAWSLCSEEVQLAVLFDF